MKITPGRDEAGNVIAFDPSIFEKAIRWVVKDPRPGGFDDTAKKGNGGFVRVEPQADGSAAIKIGPMAEFEPWGTGKPERVSLSFDGSYFPSGVPPRGSVINFTVGADPPISESVKETQAAVKTTASAVAAVSLLSSAAPSGNVAKLSMMMEINCEDGGEGEVEEIMDWTMHPLGWEVAGSLYAGALVGNGLLLGAFILIHFAVVKVLVAQGKCGAGDPDEDDGATDFQRVAGKARFPSLVYLPFAFLFQGNIFAAAKLLETADSDHPWRLVVGIGSTLVLIAQLVHVIWMTNLSKTSFKAQFMVDDVPRTGSCVGLRNFLLGRAAWISTGEAFAERWGEIFDCWRPPWHRFLVMELGHMIPLTFLAVRDVHTWSTCATNAWLMTAVLALYLVSVLLPRPYIAQFENAAMIVECALQVVAMALLAVGFHSEDTNSSAFSTAGLLMVVAMFVMLLKTLYDILAFVMGLCEGQRERLKDKIRGLGATMREEKPPPLEMAARNDSSEYAPLASELLPALVCAERAGTMENLHPAPESPRTPNGDECPAPAVGDVVTLCGLAAFAQYNGMQAEVLRTDEGTPQQRKVRVATVGGTTPGKVLRVNRINCAGPHRQEWDARRRTLTVFQQEQPASPLQHPQSPPSKAQARTGGRSNSRAQAQGNPYFVPAAAAGSSALRRSIRGGAPPSHRPRVSSPTAMSSSLLDSSIVSATGRETPQYFTGMGTTATTMPPGLSSGIRPRATTPRARGSRGGHSPPRPRQGSADSAGGVGGGHRVVVGPSTRL